MRSFSSCVYISRTRRKIFPDSRTDVSKSYTALLTDARVRDMSPSFNFGFAENLHAGRLRRSSERAYFSLHDIRRMQAHPPYLFEEFGEPFSGAEEDSGLA